MGVVRLAVLALVLGMGRAPWPFAVGETLEYDARIGMLSAGTASISVARSVTRPMKRRGRS